jgi:hypothetical protein
MHTDLEVLLVVCCQPFLVPLLLHLLATLQQPCSRVVGDMHAQTGLPTALQHKPAKITARRHPANATTA